MKDAYRRGYSGCELPPVPKGGKHAPLDPHPTSNQTSGPGPMRSLQTLSTLFRTQPAFRGLVARSFRLLQRVGLNVTPTHY